MALSQYIRTQFLACAAAEGFNLVIDTTSSSPGTLKMIEAIRQAGYLKSNMEVEGTYAPIEISRSRIERRPRKASYLELITKRVGAPAKNEGALNMIAPLIESVGKFTYKYNPDNKNPPQMAFVYKNGILQSADRAVIERIQDSSASDVSYIRDFLPRIRQAFPQFAEDLEGYEDFSNLTDDNFRKFLTSIVVGPEPSQQSAPELHQ